MLCGLSLLFFDILIRERRGDAAHPARARKL